MTSFPLLTDHWKKAADGEAQSKRQKMSTSST